MIKSLWKKGFDIGVAPDESRCLGRSASTGIKSTKCSRKQVLATFHPAESYIAITRTGFHRSFINGKEIPRDRSVRLRNGDKLELLRGKYAYACVIPPLQESLSFAETAKLAMEPQQSANWTTVTAELHVYSPPNLVASEKIAAFDLDWTVIATRSGNQFPRDYHDWQFLFPEVPGRLRKESESERRKVVFFTNQKGIRLGRQQLQPFKGKVQAILRKIPVPVQVFVCTGIGEYRKPLPGMWETLEESFNDKIPIDKSASFYVGDAAGRKFVADRKTKKADHSCVDRLFALNVGLDFFTPEEFFLKKPSEPFQLPDFDPRTLLNSRIPLLEPESVSLTSTRQELLLMVGYPGSGKSAFVQSYLSARNYSVVSRDQLKDQKRCLDFAEKELRRGVSVVVDNTNPDKVSRARYVELAAKCSVPIRCFLMNVSHAQAVHNIKYRALVGTDREHREVNEMILNSYKSKFQEPILSEGLEEIVKVNFVPNFDDAYLKKRYCMFLVEK